MKPKDRKNNFDRWFQGSQIVDAMGQPKIMYHGTRADFTEFKPSECGMVFVTEHPEVTDLYVQGYRPGTEGCMVLPLFVSCRRVFDAKNPNHASNLADLVNPSQLKKELEELSQSEWRESGAMLWLQRGEWQALERPESIKAMKTLGFDGSFVVEMGCTNLGVFDVKNLKSALGNSGLFDRNSPDIVDRRVAAQNAMDWIGDFDASRKKAMPHA